jgi:NitT/TauT family transport system substrate-binding protein
MKVSGIDDPAGESTLVQQSFDMLQLLSGDIDAAQAMTYNEYAQVLETVNPDTGELYQPEDLTVLDWNVYGTAMLQDAIWADADRLESDAAYRDAAVAFLEASFRGWAFCRDNFDACVDDVLAAGPTLGTSHQQWQLNEINKLIWPSPAGVGVMDELLWNQTIKVSTEEGILADVPTQGAFRTDLAEEALANLRDAGVDVIGDGWAPITVELREGGE